MQHMNHRPLHSLTLYIRTLFEFPNFSFDESYLKILTTSSQYSYFLQSQSLEMKFKRKKICIEIKKFKIIILKNTGKYIRIKKSSSIAKQIITKMSQLTVFLRHAKRSNNKELDLSKRELSFIPKDVFTIRAIEVLNLSENKISSVQPAIADLFRLKILNLEDNALVQLPQEMMSLPKLNVRTSNIQDLIVKRKSLRQKIPAFIDTEKPKYSQLNRMSTELFRCHQIISCIFSVKKTPSWLHQHQSKQIKKTQEKNHQNDLAWDQTIFKVQNKMSATSHGKRTQARQFTVSKVEPQTDSKNGVLQLKLDNIQLFQQISMGGFSTIHKGEYLGLQVAVKKVFNPNVSEQLMEQFNNELSMLSKYRHPKIVLLIGAVTIPPTLCIVMQYIKDGTLYDLLYRKKANLSDMQKENIIQQLISVFLYLHSHGIVHRDIKSHNVLIDNFNVKICDFGLARHKSQLNSGPMQFCGTPTYMAQELFLKKAYDESVDIFALGTLFYQIYAGQMPYAGLDPSDIKEKVIKNAELPSKIGFKKSILDIINKCRNEDPKQRPNLKELKEFNDW